MRARARAQTLTEKSDALTNAFDCCICNLMAAVAAAAKEQHVHR